MNGAASPQEADRRPLQLCPECSAKLSWNLGIDPMKRYPALVEGLKRTGLAADAARTAAAEAAMRSLPMAQTRRS